MLSFSVSLQSLIPINKLKEIKKETLKKLSIDSDNLPFFPFRAIFSRMNAMTCRCTKCGASAMPDTVNQKTYNNGSSLQLFNLINEKHHLVVIIWTKIKCMMVYYQTLKTTIHYYNFLIVTTKNSLLK